MLLPGRSSSQPIGWLQWTWGGIVAGGLFVLPSLFILIGLSWVYVGMMPVIAGLFHGIKPAVTAIVPYAACPSHRIARAENPVLWQHRSRGVRRDLRDGVAVPR